MTYKEEIIKAMAELAQDSRVVFLGQSIRYPGNLIYETLKGIPDDRKIELPVAEDMQIGMSIGMSLAGGLIPVSTFPRMDFLILAANQLVNHLDKLEAMSQGQFKPHVIIRTMVGADSPLHPGPQHCQDHTDALRHLLTTVKVVRLMHPGHIGWAYRRALQSEKSTILIEMADLYNMADERNALARKKA